MENPVHRLMTLPAPAIMVVLTLAVLVPAGVYFEIVIWRCQSAVSPADLLTARFFWAVWLGRGVGAVALSIMLLYWRSAAAIAVTITGIWLAGPPLTFLLRGMMLLAVSAGQSSWSGGILDWAVPPALLPSLITAGLLIPRSVRQAFDVS